MRLPRDGNERNRTALVTGGASGLGLAMAKQLARDGYTVILVDINEPGLEAAISQVREIRRDSCALAGDVTNAEQMEAVAARVERRTSRIDFLLINAGVLRINALEDFHDNDDLRHAIDVNLWGSALSTKVFLPFLSSGSKILFTSSAFAFMGGAGYAAYSASKAGLVTFAEAVRRELLSRDIAVYVTCPADIDTPQHEYELQNLPDWMPVADARGKLLSAEEAASRILRKCHGKRFLILINFEVKLLVFLRRILPTRLGDSILNRLFPRP